MKQILHDCARTAGPARRTIHKSQEIPKLLAAAKYGINQKTTAKRPKRKGRSTITAELIEAVSALLTQEQEVLIVFRYRTPDVCLYSLETLPNLTRAPPWLDLFLHMHPYYICTLYKVYPIYKGFCHHFRCGLGRRQGYDNRPSLDILPQWQSAFLGIDFRGASC